MRLGTTLSSDAGVAANRYSFSYSTAPTVAPALGSKTVPSRCMGETRIEKTSSGFGFDESPNTLTNATRVQPALAACASTASAFFAASVEPTGKKACSTGSFARTASAAASKNEKFKRFQRSLICESLDDCVRPPPATMVQPEGAPGLAACDARGSTTATTRAGRRKGFMGALEVVSCESHRRALLPCSCQYPNSSSWHSMSSSARFGPPAATSIRLRGVERLPAQQLRQAPNDPARLRGFDLRLWRQQSSMHAAQHLVFGNAVRKMRGLRMLDELLREVFAEFVALSQDAQRDAQAQTLIDVE